MPFLSEQVPAAIAGLNAVNNSGVSDAAVAALTTAAGLVTLIQNQASTGADQTEDYRRWAQDIQVCIDAGILTDANVGPLTTVAGLRALFTAIDPTLSTSHQGGAHFTA